MRLRFGVVLTKCNTFQWLRLKINFYSQQLDKKVKKIWKEIYIAQKKKKNEAYLLDRI